MIAPTIIISTIIILAAILSVILRKMDAKGALVGTVLAFLIWKGTGEIVLLSLFTFFVIGTFASSWKKNAYFLGYG